ncbi:unnamed protein product [Meloidogyne enterolobii]|uniref:Uncharacterized protein n=1 Tax=Meloidogyne enterolobii TaxID=390850 RepID=A0ACB0YVH9_MELEN
MLVLSNLNKSLTNGRHAIAKFRVFLLYGKSISTIKLEKSFNVLALRNLELLQQEQILQIGWEDRPGGTKSFSSTPIVVLHLFLRKPDGSKTKDLALELLSTLKHYFPEIQKSLTKLFISLSPPLIADFALLPLSTPELPCHNFRRSYVAYCDWMEQPFRDEIIWVGKLKYFLYVTRVVVSVPNRAEEPRIFLVLFRITEEFPGTNNPICGTFFLHFSSL